MELTFLGVPWIVWNFQQGEWIIRILFLWIARQKGVWFLVLGGQPIAVYINSTGDFSLCLGDADGGYRTHGVTTVMALLGMLLVARLQWWSVLMGLTMWWAAEYALKNGER